jgi:fatty-acyl-CoA synthase
MFHVNAWGLPYAAAMAGCKLVLPGAKLDGASLYELFEAEKVTITAGVPTVWLALLQHLEKNDLRLSTLKRVVIGGSAAAARHDHRVPRAPRRGGAARVGHDGAEPARHREPFQGKARRLAEDVKDALRQKQGRPVFGIDLRIVGGEGRAAPHDGVAFGDLQARGHWVIEKYFGRCR